jgi:hypothetical protein
MLNFCTLFNVRYLAKGLALYNSLLRTCPQFHLYIVAFDDITYQILSQQQLAHATLIKLDELETTELLSVKQTRTIAEYCWTCTPFTVKYCIEKFGLDHCTYLDADIYFYNDPTPLITGMGDNSVLITPHNYYHLYDQSAVSGIYCVQFVAFKNTAAGLSVLNWWANACLKWCYAKYEDGKMGDQKYLDSWPYMFDGVQICKAPGLGLAPWNAIGFDVVVKTDKIEVERSPLYFYHFHALNYLSNKKWHTGGYQIPQTIVDNIYKPYILELLAIDRSVRNEFDNIDTINTKNSKDLDMLSSKYKLGIYIIDIKRSFRQFWSDLFFSSRRQHYKNNFITVNEH